VSKNSTTVQGNRSNTGVNVVKGFSGAGVVQRCTGIVVIQFYRCCTGV